MHKFAEGHYMYRMRLPPGTILAQIWFRYARFDFTMWGAAWLRRTPPRSGSIKRQRTIPKNMKISLMLEQ